MVAAELLTVTKAIPLVMGANIGTSVTNTIVAHGHITVTDEFTRGLAGATVHDAFNILTVMVLPAPALRATRGSAEVQWKRSAWKSTFVHWDTLLVWLNCTYCCSLLPQTMEMGRGARFFFRSRSSRRVSARLQVVRPVSSGSLRAPSRTP